MEFLSEVKKIKIAYSLILLEKKNCMNTSCEHFGITKVERLKMEFLLLGVKEKNISIQLLHVNTTSKHNNKANYHISYSQSGLLTS